MLGFRTFSFSTLFVMGLLMMSAWFSLVLADGLRLPQTRLVFPAEVKSVIAGIDNRSDNTYLIKAQVIASPTEKANAPTIATPFVVTPPLFRLEPQAHYSVRVLPQGTASLPVDQESVFYLSFLAIPATKSVPGESAHVSIGLNTLIKLFYRPTGLTPLVAEAEGQLQFYAQSGETVVRNPTPYYLTLSALQRDGRAIDVALAGTMLAPFSQSTLRGITPGHEMRYAVINDFGGESVFYLVPVESTSPIAPKDRP